MKLGYLEKGFIMEDQIEYAVIGAWYQDKWIFVRHKDRDTFEIPGGHIEKGETPEQGAQRELNEETGADDFTLYSITDYAVTVDHRESYGRLYYAKVNNLSPLNPKFEIKEILLSETLPENLTYPFIQLHLHKVLEKFHKEL